LVACDQVWAEAGAPKATSKKRGAQFISCSFFLVPVWPTFAFNNIKMKFQHIYIVLASHTAFITCPP